MKKEIIINSSLHEVRIAMMEESEVVELIYINMDAIGVYVMNITAIVFAYLVCVYLAGKDLSRSLPIGVSFCFTLYIAPVIVGSFNRYELITRMGL